MALILHSPSLPLLVAAIVAGAALLLAAAARLARSRRRRYHPVVGTILHQFLRFRRIYHYHTELSRRHTTFRILRAPFQGDVYTNDPAVVEYILCTNFHNYGKVIHRDNPLLPTKKDLLFFWTWLAINQELRAVIWSLPFMHLRGLGWQGTLNYEIMRDLFGDGIFAVDGSKWRHQRKLASYQFSTRSLREHSGAVFRKNTAKLAKAISEAARSNHAIEIQDLFLKSAMDSIVEVAFGTELNCLNGSSEEQSRFLGAFDDANVQIGWRFVNPFWKLMRFFNVGMEAALRDNIRVVDDYVYKLIHSKIAKMCNQAGESNVDKEDILSRFLRESEKDPKNMSHRYLRDIALSIVIAGKDTTGGTLSWFLYMLCKHPSVQEKVAQEVAEAVRAGDNATSFQEFTANVTEESLGKMHYLHAALTETLRLYPTVPMDSKICFSDDTLPDGFDIRGGEMIVYQPYCMGRMTYIWGEDAEDFRPERWLDEHGIFCPESPFKFSAFQAGPRICLGKEFAYRQMKILAAVLLRFFRFQLRNEKETAHYKMGITLLVDQGVYLRVFHR